MKLNFNPEGKGEKSENPLESNSVETLSRPAAAYSGETKEFYNDEGEKIENPIQRNSEYSQKMIKKREKFEKEAKALGQEKHLELQKTRSDANDFLAERLGTDGQPFDLPQEETIFDKNEFNHQDIEGSFKDSPEGLSLQILQDLGILYEKGTTKEDTINQITERFGNVKLEKQEALAEYLGDIGALAGGGAQQAGLKELIERYYDQSFAEPEPIVRTPEEEKRMHTHPEDMEPFLAATYLKVIDNPNTAKRREYLERFYKFLSTDLPARVKGKTFTDFLSEQEQAPKSYPERVDVLRKFLTQGK